MFYPIELSKTEEQKLFHSLTAVSSGFLKMITYWILTRLHWTKAEEKENLKGAFSTYIFLPSSLRRH